MTPSTRKYWILSVLVLVLAVSVVLVVLIRKHPPERSKPETSLEALRSLPYVSHVKETDQRKKKIGVQMFDRELAYPGVNLYCNHFDRTTGAFLIDMDGRIIHRWALSDGSAWKLVVVDGEGNVVGSLFKKDSKKLVKLDRNSNVVFEVPGEFHHDIHLLDDGRILTLGRKIENVRYDGHNVAVINDYLVILTADGRIQEEVSLLDVVRRSEIIEEILRTAARRKPKFALDLLHANTAGMLNRDVPGFCEKGDVLICMRNLELVLVFDYRAGRIKWEYYGNGVWQHPHEPMLLDNGNLLVFDNGYNRKYSRIIELDPITKEIVWEYKADPPESFYTEVRGSNQRFPNGNTLVTERDSGRVFEVTTDGTIVWEWYNPLFSQDGKRAIIYRMKRLDRELSAKLLDKAR
jgi:hypothetical protein